MSVDDVTLHLVDSKVLAVEGRLGEEAKAKAGQDTRGVAARQVTVDDQVSYDASSWELFEDAVV